MSDLRSDPPLLLMIFGPPAVGKMAVGRAIADRTGLKLLHNHLTIEPVLTVFPYSSPAFERLVAGFRREIFEEVAASDLYGLIITFVWAFDLPEDRVSVERSAEPFQRRGARVLYLELEATLEERLTRNESALRLAEKPSKRDLVGSRNYLLRVEERNTMNSGDEFRGRDDFLRIDNTFMSPDQVAEQVVDYFGLNDTSSK